MVHTNPAESGRWCWNKSQRRNRGTPPQPCAAACPRTGQKHFQSKMPRIGQNLRQFATIRLILSQNLLTLPAEHKVQSDSATRPVWSEYLSTNNRSTSPLSSAVLDVMEPSSGLMVPLSGAHRRRRQQKSGEKKRGTWATNGRPKQVRPPSYKGVDAYVPAGQSLQAVALSLPTESSHEPVSHGMQELANVAPRSRPYFPCAHGRQSPAAALPSVAA